LKAAFDNADRALWPGQFVQVQTRIGLDRAAIVVPSSAVQTGQNTTQIYVVKPDQTVELRAVKLLRVAGDTSLIAQGLRAGETVVTDGQLRLMPGAKVEFKNISSLLENAAKSAGAGDPKS
jgi:multidrug efflux system membrane fusion protein